jgi:hypothetical protein
MISRRRFFLTTAVAVLFSISTVNRPLYAHDEGACREDVKKLCGDVKPGGGAIGDCLKTHADSLSQGCKENMAEGRKRMKEFEQACQADMKQFCANVTPGEGREFACLRAYDDKISAGCKEKMPQPQHPMGSPVK